MELIHRYCERDNSIRNYISLENWASKQEISGLLKSSTMPFAAPRDHTKSCSLSIMNSGHHAVGRACCWRAAGV
jgi:hypothetical protein